MDDSKDARATHKYMVRLLMPKDPPTPSTPWANSQIEVETTKDYERTFRPDATPAVIDATWSHNVPESAFFPSEFPLLTNEAERYVANSEEYKSTPIDLEVAYVKEREPTPIGLEVDSSLEADKESIKPIALDAYDLLDEMPRGTFDVFQTLKTVVEEYSAEVDSCGLVGNRVQADIQLVPNLDRYPKHLKVTVDPLEVKITDIVSEDMLELVDNSKDSFDVRLGDFKLNSIIFLEIPIAHKVFVKLFEEQIVEVNNSVALPSTLGDNLRSIESFGSFVFDPGKYIDLSL